MQAKPTRRRARPTLTEQARRAQIIAAAIETIAELGYSHTSFSQIAKRAGLSSTGLISYHFASKKALDWAVVQEIYDQLTKHMTKAMEGITNPHAALVAYIQGLIGFMKIVPFALRAMIDIVMQGGFDCEADSERETLSPVSPPARRA